MKNKRKSKLKLKVVLVYSVIAIIAGYLFLKGMDILQNWLIALINEPKIDFDLVILMTILMSLLGLFISVFLFKIRNNSRKK